MLLDTAQAFFNEAEWAYEVDDNSTIRAIYEGDTIDFPVYIIANEDDQQLGVYGVLPKHVDDAYRLPVGAFLAALNYGLKIGNFEIDLGDGEVRFRADIDIEGGVLTAAMVRSMAASCVLNVDLYAPAIHGVASGEISPLQALDIVGQ